jgi:hypothetical protein
MYHAWANCHFTDLLNYLALLWSLDSINQPSPSGTFMSQEYTKEIYAQYLLQQEAYADSWWMLDGSGVLDAERPVS